MSFFQEQTGKLPGWGLLRPDLIDPSCLSGSHISDRAGEFRLSTSGLRSGGPERQMGDMIVELCFVLNNYIERTFQELSQGRPEK